MVWNWQTTNNVINETARFNDPHGFFLNCAVNKIIELSGNSGHQFLNLNQKTTYRNDHTTYLRRNITDFRRCIRELPTLESVTFYPLDFTSVYFLNELRKKQGILDLGWVFWGYEFYHRPDNYASNLETFSLSLYKRQHSFLKRTRFFFTSLVKRTLSIPVYNKPLLDESIAQVNRFYSFLPLNFENVFKGIKGAKASYFPLAFLSIKDITGKLQPREKKLSMTIMVGHAATLSINHAEILDQLSRLKIDNDLFLPLEYGANTYRDQIKTLANMLFGDRVEFLEKRLEINKYYERLLPIGFGIFNFRREEALGNILFLIWNGAKVFLKDESTVSRQFKDWGIATFSIERELNEIQLSELLSPAVAAENKRIIEDILSTNRVNQYWQALVSG